MLASLFNWFNVQKHDEQYLHCIANIRISQTVIRKYLLHFDKWHWYEQGAMNFRLVYFQLTDLTGF